MAFAKVGVFGFAGAGKTRTATDIAIGLAKAYGGENPKPIYFVDTETGSDFMIPRVKSAGLKLEVLKSRAFSLLTQAIPEAEANASVLILDSLTHFWRELCDSYQKKLNRKRLQFQDWQVIKGEWGLYTDLFLNSKLHIIACGRAGYDYNHEVNEDGTKDLVKTGTKMKAESEFGFEPSLVIEMESRTVSQDELEAAKKIANKWKRKDAFAGISANPGGNIINRAHVLKDRWDILNGKHFDYPTFDDFRPHFDMLNIGGEHLGVDVSKDSQGLFNSSHGSNRKELDARREYAKDTAIKAIAKPWPGATKDEKSHKNFMFELVFEELSTKVLDTMELGALEIKAGLLKDWAGRIGEFLEGAEDVQAAASACWKEVNEANKAVEDMETMPEGF